VAGAGYAVEEAEPPSIAAAAGAASLAFGGAAVVGSAVAIREQLPGQPCDISAPLSVPAGLLVGWGAGVAAPWPMPAAAVFAAARSHRTQPSTPVGRVCAGIGMGCILGHRDRTRHPPAASLVADDQARDRPQHSHVSGPHRGRVAPPGGSAQAFRPPNQANSGI
jgi:hypothetical protein